MARGLPRRAGPGDRGWLPHVGAVGLREPASPRAARGTPRRIVVEPARPAAVAQPDPRRRAGSRPRRRRDAALRAARGHRCGGGGGDRRFADAARPAPMAAGRGDGAFGLRSGVLWLPHAVLHSPLRAPLVEPRRAGRASVCLPSRRLALCRLLPAGRGAGLQPRPVPSAVGRRGSRRRRGRRRQRRHGWGAAPDRGGGGARRGRGRRLAAQECAPFRRLGLLELAGLQPVARSGDRAAAGLGALLLGAAARGGRGARRGSRPGAPALPRHPGADADRESRRLAQLEPLRHDPAVGGAWRPGTDRHRAPTLEGGAQGARHLPKPLHGGRRHGRAVLRCLVPAAVRRRGLAVLGAALG